MFHMLFLCFSYIIRSNITPSVPIFIYFIYLYCILFLRSKLMKNDPTLNSMSLNTINVKMN